MKKTRADSQKLIESSSRNVEIKVGETIRLKTLSGEEATWISKDSSIVRVYSDGRVKGLSTGLAMVWAHFKDSDTPELHAVSVVNIYR